MMCASTLVRVGLLALQAAWAIEGGFPGNTPSYLSEGGGGANTTTKTQAPQAPPPPPRQQHSTLEPAPPDEKEQRDRTHEGGGASWAAEGGMPRTGSRMLWRWFATGSRTGERARNRGGGRGEGDERGLATPLVTRLQENATGAASDTGQWKGAGGEFGLSADWREALSVPGGGDSEGRGAGKGLRGGDACLTENKQAEVREILEKRGTASTTTNRVAVCLRTKDFARFLPEWIAFHYALGVDEIMIYDDDSTDNTEEVLRPFVEAGIVRYIFEVIFDRVTQMKPLNHCLEQHLERRSRGDEDAATWVLFHDTDEYLYPSDTSLNIRDALEKHHRTCCALVSRVQYGSAGHDEMPRGLLLENFLMHSHPGPQFGNGLGKVMVNLDPSEPELGVVEPPLRSMHNAEGCDCAGAKTGGVSDLRINHYLGSIGDYMDRTTRYWEGKKKGEMAAAKTVLHRDVNDYRSDDIEHWACATREVLFRIMEGLDLEGGGERGGGGEGGGEGEGEGGVKAVSKLEP